MRTFHVTAPPPPAIDWRMHHGINYVTSIKNQRTCGSCVSFATCASLEFVLPFNKGRTTRNLIFQRLTFSFVAAGCVARLDGILRRP